MFSNNPSPDYDSAKGTSEDHEVDVLLQVDSLYENIYLLLLFGEQFLCVVQAGSSFCKV